MKGHVQAPVFPGCTLYHEAEKLSLLARALALEFLARDTGQPHHVEPRSQIGGRRSVFVDLRAERILSCPIILGLEVVLMSGDSTVQLVVIHRIETTLKPVTFVLP